MTTQLFIGNGSIYTFELYDIDGNHYDTIRAIKRYSVTLPISSTFDKQYKLTSVIGNITFSLTINGLLNQPVASNSLIFVDRESEYGFPFDFNKLVIEVGGILDPALP